jgi:hypothetical protein
VLDGLPRPGRTSLSRNAGNDLPEPLFFLPCVFVHAHHPLSVGMSTSLHRRRRTGCDRSTPDGAGQREPRRAAPIPRGTERGCRINMEADLMYKLREQWTSRPYQDYRRISPQYVKQQFIVNDELQERYSTKTVPHVRVGLEAGRLSCQRCWPCLWQTVRPERPDRSAVHRIGVAGGP